MACICAFFGLSIVALILGLVSHAEARKQGLKMHAAGMVGLIFGAIGTAGWTLFWGLFIIGITAAGTTHTSSMPASSTTNTVAAGSLVSDVHTQMTTWYSGGGQTHINDITADLNNIGTTATAANMPGLLAACGALNSDTAAANNYGPVPDTEAQATWAQGLAYFNRSGSECVAGVQSNNAALINQANSDMRTGTTFITQAGNRIHALGN
jgi:hypothetical protein